MGVYNFPILTFSAFIVIGISILAAVIWAVCDIRRNDSGKGGVS